MILENALIYLDNSFEETLKLLEEISIIPAPSNHEEKRAQFCKNWLDGIGAKEVYIDEALNVVYPVYSDNPDGETIVFMAHTDTVFPDMTEPMPYRREGNVIYSPGVGDDTICLVLMLMTIKYIVENNIKPKKNVVFVANSGEEGLGNLKGCRKIMETYGSKVTEFYTFDGMYRDLVEKCVGSHRYKITIETTGGHSFSNFGNRNAIVAMAELICNLNNCKVPVIGNSKTTFNVGIIEGGTSVNTIAQKGSFLYEYRSDNYDCLVKMQEFFENQIKKAKEDKDAKITVETVGIRPCGKDVNEEKLGQMADKVIEITKKHTGIICARNSGSTDANIPMSMGIPALCVGTYLGGGAHTREEYLYVDSISKGIKITAELILSFFEDDEK